MEKLLFHHEIWHVCRKNIYVHHQFVSEFLKCFIIYFDFLFIQLHVSSGAKTTPMKIQILIEIQHSFSNTVVHRFNIYFTHLHVDLWVYHGTTHKAINLQLIPRPGLSTGSYHLCLVFVHLVLYTIVHHRRV